MTVLVYVRVYCTWSGPISGRVHNALVSREASDYHANITFVSGLYTWSDFIWPLASLLSTTTREFRIHPLLWYFFLHRNRWKFSYFPYFEKSFNWVSRRIDILNVISCASEKLSNDCTKFNSHFYDKLQSCTWHPSAGWKRNHLRHRRVKAEPWTLGGVFFLQWCFCTAGYTFGEVACSWPGIAFFFRTIRTVFPCH